MKEPRRYDIHYDEDDGYLERSYCGGGDHVDAYEALDVITEQKERIEELEALVKKLRCCENCERRGELNYVDYECKRFAWKELLKNRCFETREFWEEGK